MKTTLSRLSQTRFLFNALLPGLILLTAAGCGKPPAGGGQGGDFPVNSVLAPVNRQALEEKIFLVGSLEANERVDLVSEVDARIVEILFDEGQPVEEGQLLIRLESRRLEAAVEEMRARFNLARANLERSATLLDRETISEQDYDQAVAEYDAAEALLNIAKEALEDASIHSPFHGIMTERLVSPGQYTTRGQRLASLVDVHPIEVEFNIPERFIGELRMGQRIEISVEAFQGETFRGEVVFISPVVDRQSRTVLVKARIPNEDGRLKPGMFGNLELIFRLKESALVIPEAAISYSGDQAMVVVANAEMKAEFRTVDVGSRLSGNAEILSGLEEGELVVVEGFQKMGPGSSIVASEESRRYGVNPEDLQSPPSGGDAE